MQALKFLKLAIAVLDSMANRLANQGGFENVIIKVQQQGCCHDLHLETLIRMIAILLLPSCFLVYRRQTL
jgi:hypothetical protein